MLNQKSQSLLKRQPHLSSWRLPNAIGFLCLMGSVLLSACGKGPEATPTNSANVPSTVQKDSPASDSKIDAAISDALTPPRASLPAAALDEFELTAEAEKIVARYPDKNAVELLNVPEVNEKLRNGLKKLGADPELGKRINSTVELAAKLKGLEGTPGSARLDMDIKGYDKARTTRMLETVLSEDPKRIVSFLVEEIGEATPELSLGGVKRASNGVAIESNPPPPPPK
jgi:hypothetical protein